MTTSPDWLAAYHRDGYAAPLPALEPGETVHYRAACEALLARSGGGPVRWAHLHFGWARDLATHPRILNAAAAVLGEEILVYGTLIMAKPPHSRAFVSWHQDSAYASLAGANYLSVWVALTASTTRGGCLRAIPGSHRLRLPHARRPHADNMLSHGQFVNDPVDESRARALPLAPGEISLHHLDLVHGSLPNRSARTRLGFVIRFVSPGLTPPGFPLLRARGHRPAPLLDLWRDAPADEPEAEFAAWSAFRRGRGERD